MNRLGFERPPVKVKVATRSDVQNFRSELSASTLGHLHLVFQLTIFKAICHNYRCTCR